MVKLQTCSFHYYLRQFIELRIAVATEHFVNRMNIVFQNQVATKFKSRVFGPLNFKFVFVDVIEHQGRTLINLCFIFSSLWAVRAFKTLRFCPAVRRQTTQFAGHWCRFANSPQSRDSSYKNTAPA